MTRILIEIPRVGLVMETARVVRWLKEIGDSVAPGEPMLEVETEKSIVEIEASSAGRLVEILALPDQEVAIGAPIAWLEDGEVLEAAEVPSMPVPATAVTAVGPEPVPASRDALAADGNRQRSSPAARKLAAEHGIELSRIRGTGPGGRIQLEDVQALTQPGAATASAPGTLAFHISSSAPFFSATRAKMWERRRFSRSMSSSSESMKAISRSRETYSLRWRGVSCFSAR